MISSVLTPNIQSVSSCSKVTIPFCEAKTISKQNSSVGECTYTCVFCTEPNYYDGHWWPVIADRHHLCQLLADLQPWSVHVGTAMKMKGEEAEEFTFVKRIAH